MAKNNGNKFSWGVATSAHQIEGSLQNDMTDWEARGRFEQSGNSPLVGRATDHWQRWEEDFKLLKELGVNSYRFSIEWARIEPDPGHINYDAIEQYRRMIDRLLEYGISPMVTLHHFSNPTWLHQHSPWHRPEASDAFAKYVHIIAPKLLKNVPLVVTFNEPMVWLLAAYADGKFPPGFSDFRILSGALYTMLHAHRRAYDIIKAECGPTQIGIAHNLIVFKEGREGHIIDGKIKRLVHEFYNIMIPQAFVENRLYFNFPFILNINTPIELDNKVDFWGINYYYRMRVQFKPSLKLPFKFYFAPPSESKKTDMGWEIYAKGLHQVCDWMSEYKKPLYITENGIASKDDNKRVKYLQKHLKTLNKIRDKYPDLEGYYHWTFLDNYEWLVGYEAQFGLCGVDFNNGLDREIKPSGYFYRDHILADLKDS